MERKQTWIAGAAALGLAALFLWGLFGGGTAAELAPEPVKTVSPAEMREEAPSREGEQTYDAAVFRRSAPLRDPFRLAQPEENKQPIEPVPVSPKVQDVGKTAKAKAAPPPKPVLRGTMVSGKDRRAVLEYDGKTVTVKEGEQVGTWQVTAISRKKVVLSSPLGDEVLSLS